MILLDGCSLTAPDVARVALYNEEVQLEASCLDQVEKSCALLQQWGDAGEIIYGVTTGFGDLVHMVIPPRHKESLQLNLLRSHAAGGGPPLDETAVRAMSLARLNCLVKGHSGCSVAVLRLMTEFLNRRIHPVVPSQGSLGASGDLAPLAHLALPLIGEGFVNFRGRSRPSREVLAEQGLQPVHLGYKEALSLINGTSGMTGLASLIVPECYHLLRWALLLSSDLLLHLGGSSAAFEKRGHELKNHTGQIAVAASIRSLLSGSEGSKQHADIVRELSGRRDDGRVVDSGIYIQNAYTLRCVPQILGPVIETFDFASRIVDEELNSCNDNPLIFDSPKNIFHGGNFHGQYVAMACDYLNIALTEIGVLAERQLDRLLNPALNSGLPAFLAAGEVGLYSGLEGGQYLATSSASENLDLATPSSIKSIPSNASNQDVVSMGMIAARKGLRIISNVTNILTCLTVACQQSWYLRGERETGPVLNEFHHLLKAEVPLYRDHCVLADIFRACSACVNDRQMRTWINEQVLNRG